MRHGQERVDSLREYSGPKLAKHLRRDINRQVHALHEKITLLRLLDPAFEEELRGIGALDFIDSFSHLVSERQRQAAECFAQSSAALGRQETN
jgi:hypothetical protein